MVDMKNNSQIKDLEQMLATLEHAGRDERRQQELGTMIDRMAGVESKENKRGFWWWGVRVAAAACVLFFISTAVRIWFIPTDEAVQVAQAEVPEVPAVVPSPAEGHEEHTIPTPRIKKEMPMQLIAAIPEQQPIEEQVAEEVAVPEAVEPLDTAEVPAVIIEDDFAPDTELMAEAVVDEQPVVVDLPREEHQPEAEKPTLGSFFKSLFRMAEPSNMDGTTLSLLEF